MLSRLSAARMLLVAALVAFAGCKRSEPESPKGSSSASRSTAPTLSQTGQGKSEAVLALHWAGKKRIASDTNASTVMEIWNLPESSKLESQTIERLAWAPVRWLSAAQGPSIVIASPSATNTQELLRPLAEDLLQEESFWKVGQSGAQSRQVAFAVRLPETRAGLWETNLAKALENLTGQRSAPLPGLRSGWLIRQAARNIEHARAGDWTVVGVSSASNSAFKDMLDSIARNGSPFVQRQTNFWLEADVNLERFADKISPEWFPTNGLPRLMLSVLGENQTVRTVGQLIFPKDLSFVPEKWNIPTNLIHEPLASFVAIQGTRALIGSCPILSRMLPGFMPNQVFFWAQGRSALQNFLAIPAPDSSNQVW